MFRLNISGVIALLLVKYDITEILVGRIFVNLIDSSEVCKWILCAPLYNYLALNKKSIGHCFNFYVNFYMSLLCCLILFGSIVYCVHCSLTKNFQESMLSLSPPPPPFSALASHASILVIKTKPPPPPHPLFLPLSQPHFSHTNSRLLHPDYIKLK